MNTTENEFTTRELHILLEAVAKSHQTYSCMAYLWHKIDNMIIERARGDKV
jgi:hypothetical protein